MGQICCKNEPPAQPIQTSLINPITPDFIPKPAALIINEYNPIPQFELMINIDESNVDYMVQKDEKQYSLNDIANEFINGLSQYIDQQKQNYENDNDIYKTGDDTKDKQSIHSLQQISISESTHLFQYKGKGLLTLGLVLQYIMLNRPYYLPITIIPQWFMHNNVSIKNDDDITFGVETVDTFWPNDLLNIQGPPHKELIINSNFKDIIRAYHLHCHFYENGHSEALALHIALFKHLEEGVQSKSILYRKNGPHNYWNWQIYIEDIFYLAKGVCFMSVNKQNGSYLLFHCRTYDKNIRNNEWADHALRLGWIGDTDSIQKLDVDFFHDHLHLKQQEL